jgi:parvulin-like peptidyl-prolyl isomerase
MDRVQQSAMKDIPVTNAEVQERLSLIAKQNNITLSKMKSVLKSQGVRWSKYQDKIRNVIKKDKFFRMKIAQDITPPSKTELKKLYDKTKKTLFIPSSISVVEYKSKNQKSLQEAIKAKKIKGKWKRLYTKDLEPSMLNILMRTPNGGYTQPMNAGGEYIAYKVVSKSGKRAMSFELAQPILSRMYQREQQDKLLKEYFAKEKLKAKIKKLR